MVKTLGSAFPRFWDVDVDATPVLPSLSSVDEAWKTAKQRKCKLSSRLATRIELVVDEQRKDEDHQQAEEKRGRRCNFL
jgi:hypothetical protein